MKLTYVNRKNKGRKNQLFDSIHYDQRYVSLLEVYQSGSFTAAGNVLSLTPSAVAQQVHSIEREINALLFIKSEHKLIPTKECEVVIKYINKIQSMCRRMSDDIELSKKNLEHLAIGITPSAVSIALSGVIEKLSQRTPPLQITVTTGNAAQLCEQLENYTIDLAVIEGSCSTDSFSEVMLDTDYLCVVVPMDSVYAKRGVITVNELQRETLIMKPLDSGTRKLFRASLDSVGISEEKFFVIMEVGSVDTIIRLVSGHYGLSVLAKKACMAAAEAGKIATVPLQGINMTRSIRIVYRKKRDYREILGEIQRSYDATMRERNTISD